MSKYVQPAGKQDLLAAHYFSLKICKPIDKCNCLLTFFFNWERHKG